MLAGLLSDVVKHKTSSDMSIGASQRSQVQRSMPVAAEATFTLAQAVKDIWSMNRKIKVEGKTARVQLQSPVVSVLLHATVCTFQCVGFKDPRLQCWCVTGGAFRLSRVASSAGLGFASLSPKQQIAGRWWVALFLWWHAPAPAVRRSGHTHARYVPPLLCCCSPSCTTPKRTTLRQGTTF